MGTQIPHMAHIDYHSEVAQSEIHWFNPSSECWISRTAEDRWQGWSASGAPVVTNGPWIPWDRAFNGEAHPFVRWFEGGKTNAAFNEVDRHVLAGHADEVAAIGFDEADSIRRLSRGELLVESAVRACELSA